MMIVKFTCRTCHGRIVLMGGPLPTPGSDADYCAALDAEVATEDGAAIVGPDDDATCPHCGAEVGELPGADRRAR